MAVVRLRWDIGARCPREPLHRIMGLQAGVAQPTLVECSEGAATLILQALRPGRQFRHHADLSVDALARQNY